MKRKTKQKKFVFLQDIDPYFADVLVCAGVSLEEAKRFVKKEFKPSFRKPFAEWLDSDKELFDTLLRKEMKGYTIFDKKKIYLAILLQEVQDDWQYWETLMHELHHLVEHVSNVRMLDDEIEAKAYLQEHLFRSIRRKLQGVEAV